MWQSRERERKRSYRTRRTSHINVFCVVLRAAVSLPQKVVNFGREAPRRLTISNLVKRHTPKRKKVGGLLLPVSSVDDGYWWAVRNGE